MFLRAVRAYLSYSGDPNTSRSRAEADGPAGGFIFLAIEIFLGGDLIEISFAPESVIFLSVDIAVLSL